MADFVPSLIRTWVPTFVGALIVFLADFGVDIGSEDATVFFTGLAIGVYYAIVRYLEGKFPAVGVLLGSRNTPQYDDA